MLQDPETTGQNCQGKAPSDKKFKLGIGLAPAGVPRKLDFEEKGTTTYSPRNLDPASPKPFVAQPVRQMVAAYEGAMQGLERPVHLLRVSLLRVLESNFPGDSLYNYMDMRVPTP